MTPCRPLPASFCWLSKSGLNITHSEDYARFTTRFGAASARLRPALDAFAPDDIRNWASELGTETFIGSSGRVFPKVMKASPLLRAWLRRLEAQGATLRTRHRWTGFAEDGYVFETPEGRGIVHCDAALLALGGASWPRLGSDATWVPWLVSRGVEIDTFQPANCGFVVGWSRNFSERFVNEPVKSVTATSEARHFSRRIRHHRQRHRRQPRLYPYGRVARPAAEPWQRRPDARPRTGPRHREAEPRPCAAGRQIELFKPPAQGRRPRRRQDGAAPRTRSRARPNRSGASRPHDQGPAGAGDRNPPDRRSDLLSSAASAGAASTRATC